MVRIFTSLDDALSRFGPCALTIGNFDGVHEGHRRILRRVAAVAAESGWKASVLTFHPHPTRIVAPDRAPKLLTTPEERALLMAEEGIAQVLILPFTVELSRLSPEQFVTEVLRSKLDARAVLVGDNFRFGHGHAGDTRLLAELGRRYGFATEVIPAVRLRGRTVSSSEVRRLVQDGNVSLAARLLASRFALEGDVAPGRGVGSRVTVPTLNLAPSAEVLPATGVYITCTREVCDRCDLRSWPSVTNVGYRPTFGGDGLTVETFLLEPLEGDSPRRIRVEFFHRLREERRFPDPASLKAQILRDAARARSFFRRLKG
jgi:riboflavin kinase/FMN adenylyltransferase